MANESTSLFPLRRPFTHASVKDDLVSFDIDGEYAGTLKVPSGRIPNILLHVFADTNRVAGELENGRVEWQFDPSVYGYTVVIDDCGRLLNVGQLGEG